VRCFYPQVLNNATANLDWLQRNYFLRWVLRFWAKKLACKFVLLDCAPANSEINGMILSNVDVIMPPAFPDQYSTDSLRALFNRVLPKYMKKKRQECSKLRKYARFAQSHYDTHSRWKELVHLPFPRILPVCITNFEACYDTDKGHLTMSTRSAMWCHKVRRGKTRTRSQALLIFP
jgi:hypothetical protein